MCSSDLDVLDEIMVIAYQAITVDIHRYAVDIFSMRNLSRQMTGGRAATRNVDKTQPPDRTYAKRINDQVLHRFKEDLHRALHGGQFNSQFVLNHGSHDT